MGKKLGIIVGSFFIFSIFYCDIVFGLGSGGYRNEVVDGVASGKGYTFTAQADGPSAVHYNPAGLIQLKGSSVSLGYTLESLRNEVDSEFSGDTVQMQKQIFLLPNFYFVDDLSTENFRFGLAVLSPYGLSTDWADDSFSQYVMTESDLQIVTINPALAYKINDNLSIAGGLDYLTAHLSKHKVLIPQASSNGDFQLKGSDDGWGYNLGLLLRQGNKHRIGISYRSEINLTYRGEVTLDNLSASYTGMMGGSSYTTPMTTDSTIPRSLAVGYAYQPNKRWTIEADVEWTDWACVEEDLVKYPDESDPTRLAVLNDGNPTSRDWRDVFAYGIGAEYKATDKLDLRCGFFYHESPIPSANFDTPLPDADKQGLTVGLGYLFNDVKIDTSYAFIKYSDRNVTNDVGSSSKSNINGEYRAYVNLFAVAFTYAY